MEFTRKTLPIVALVALAGLWAALPGQSTQTFDGGGTQSYKLENQTVDSLEIRRAAGVTLRNVTVTGTLYIESSHTILLSSVSIGSTYGVYNATNLVQQNVSVSGAFYLQSSQSATLERDVYASWLYITNSTTIHFESPKFQGSVCVQDSSVTYSNVTSSNANYLQCPTTTTPTPTPTATSTAGNATTATPGPTAGPTTETTRSPSPTTYTYSTTPKPTGTTQGAPTTSYNYRFELQGQTVHQDLSVYAAESVKIVDTQIYGNLYVAWSGPIHLERVQISGQLYVENSHDLFASGLQVGNVVGFSSTEGFTVQDSRIGGDLGCYRCAHGVYSNLQVSGGVHIEESVDIQRIDVASSAYTTPATSALPTAVQVIAFNVDQSNLEFVHQKPVAGTTPADVRVAVDAVLGKAEIQLESRPGVSAIQLESHFEKVLEFEDRNGNGKWDLSDLVVREYLIDELPIAGIQQERLAGTEEGWVGRVNYQLPGGGTFSLIFTAKDNDPDNTKIDVEFRDYAYQTAASQLALQVRLASASDWEIQEGPREDRLVFFGNGYNGFFSWIRTAEVDGATTDVRAQVLEEHRTASGEREIVLYLGYERGDHILHDPSLGIFEADVLPGLGNLLVYGSTLVAVFVVLWALGQGNRRRPPVTDPPDPDTPQ